MQRIITLTVLALTLAACGGGNGTATEPSATPEASVSKRCERAFRTYDTVIREDENKPVSETRNEEPYQRRTIRACTRDEWLLAAEGYRDTVALAEPVEVLDAFCGIPRSKAPACRE